jgi:hypothetical protein
MSRLGARAVLAARRQSLHDVGTMLHAVVRGGTFAGLILAASPFATVACSESAALLAPNGSGARDAGSGGSNEPPDATRASGGTGGTTGDPDAHGSGGIAGMQGTGGASGSSGGTSTGGSGGVAGGSGGAAGSSGDASAGGAPNDGGDAGSSTLDDTVARGPAAVTTTPRSSFGALAIANDGERIYAVESRRDVEPGPFGLPWRSRFRVAAYDGAVEAWAHAAEPDDVVSDVAVHPSGDITIAILRHPVDRMAFDMVRLNRNGSVVGTTTLADFQTVPASDFASTSPRPHFRMKSDFADATSAQWVRLLPDGEGLAIALLSYIDVPQTDPLYRRMLMGVARLDRQSNAYVERWARIVDGPHTVQPAAWAYDELRWLEQAYRPFLARDDSTGDLVVGRAWNTTRCAANVAVFAEFTTQECVIGSVNPVENELLPLAVTRFSSLGVRAGTHVLAPDDDAAEQLAFALTARAGQLAVAGAVVRKNPDDTKRTYPDPSGYVDYDGYVSVYDGSGHLVRSHDFNAGRGDVLASMRWTDGGIVAVGSAGWDRWQGGMSISRGSDPFVTWLAPDGTRSAMRTIPMSNGTRHFNLHDLVVIGDHIVTHGFSDAPMTHSGDGGNTVARTFGALQIRLDSAGARD